MPDTARQALWRTAMAGGFCVYQEHKLAEQPTVSDGMPPAESAHVMTTLREFWTNDSHYEIRWGVHEFYAPGQRALARRQSRSRVCDLCREWRRLQSRSFRSRRPNSRPMVQHQNRIVEHIFLRRGRPGRGAETAGRGMCGVFDRKKMSTTSFA